MTGVLLSSLGVFGTMSYVVSQRRSELVAGLRIAAVGVVIGLVLSLVGTLSPASFPVGVSPVDPVTLAVVALLLASGSLAACYWPGRIAASVDPMAVLRRE